MVVGGRGCSWGHLNAHTCAHVCTCVHMCARVGAYMCVHGAGACGGGRGEFVLVVGCMCVDGWWLRRVLSSLT